MCQKSENDVSKVSIIYIKKKYLSNWKSKRVIGIVSIYTYKINL